MNLSEREQQIVTDHNLMVTILARHGVIIGEHLQTISALRDEVAEQKLTIAQLRDELVSLKQKQFTPA